MRNPETNRGQSNHIHPDIELLSAYIDNEATPEEVRQVERHLQSCQACSDELASLKWAVNLLREIPPIPVPRSFAIRQVDIEPEPARRRFVLPDWLFNSLQWATVATAILTILVFAADLFIVAQPATAPAPGVLQIAEESAPEAAMPEVEKEAAPVAEPTVETRRNESVEPASGPSEVPAMPPQPPVPEDAAPQAQALSQPPADQAETETMAEAVPEASAQSETAKQLAEEPSAREPTLASKPVNQTQSALRPTNRLRLIEISLVGLFILLLGFTVWARRRRAT